MSAALLPPPCAHCHRAVQRYLWVMLLARFCEAFPTARSDLPRRDVGN